MAKKEISGYVKLQIKGGQANPAPPVGPALGQRGINIMEFCKAFNDKTKSLAGRNIIGSISKKQLKEIAEKKMQDLNAHDLDEAAKIIAGSARSMGIEVKD